MFCATIPRVRLARSGNGRCRRSSFIRATPAELVAMSEPVSPMATPTSADADQAVVDAVADHQVGDPWSRAGCSCFSSGRHSASMESTATVCPPFATEAVPVKMQTLRTPASRSPETASTALDQRRPRAHRAEVLLVEHHVELDMPSIFCSTSTISERMPGFMSASQSGRPTKTTPCSVSAFTSSVDLRVGTKRSRVISPARQSRGCFGPGGG